MSGQNRKPGSPDTPVTAGAFAPQTAQDRIWAAGPIRMRPEEPPVIPQAGSRMIVMRGHELLKTQSISTPAAPPGPPAGVEPGPEDQGEWDGTGPPPPGYGETMKALNSGNPGMRTGAVILLLVLILAVLNAIYNFKPARSSGPPSGSGPPPGVSQGTGPPPGVSQSGGPPTSMPANGAPPGSSVMPLASFPSGQCILTGRIIFKDGTKPEFFQQVSNGPKQARLYQYPGMDITLFIGDARINQPAVVDEGGKMGTLFSLPSGQENAATVEQVIADREGYRRVVFKNLPISQGKLALPDIVMIPETSPKAH